LVSAYGKISGFSVFLKKTGYSGMATVETTALNNEGKIVLPKLLLDVQKIVRYN